MFAKLFFCVDEVVSHDKKVFEYDYTINFCVKNSRINLGGKKMAYGIFLFEDADSKDAKLIKKVLLEEIKGESIPTISTLNKISLKHNVFGDQEHIRKHVSYRSGDYKYFSMLIDSSDSSFIFLGFILEFKETSEVFSIKLPSTTELIKIGLNKGDSTLKKILTEILAERNSILEEIHNIKLIEKKISSKANVLLDNGKFEKAQSLIKLAKEIPPKLVEAVNKGDSAFNEGKFRRAQRSYEDAAELAEEISEIGMMEVLQKKAHRAESVPAHVKDLSKTLKSINRPLKKIDKREKGFYLEPINDIEDAIAIADTLEDDVTIDQLQELEDLLEDADEISKKLNDIDNQIRILLTKLDR